MMVSKVMEPGRVSRATNRRPTSRSVVVYAALAVLGGSVVGALIGLTGSPLALAVVFAGLAVLLLTLFRVEWGLLALVFITYTRFSDVAIDYHGAPSIAKFFMVYILVVILVRWRLFNEQPVGWERPTLLFGLFGLASMVSILIAADQGRAMGALSTYVRDALTAMMVVLLLQSSGVLRRVMWALIAAGAFLAAISFIQVVTGSYDNNFGGFALAPVLHIIEDTNDYRVAGPIGDPNFYAQIMLPLIPLALDRVRNERSWWLRVAAAAALGLCILAIIFTFSRGAFVALVAVLLGMLVYRPPRPGFWIAAAVGAALLLPLVPSQYLQRIGTLGDLLAGGTETVYDEPSFRGRASEIMVGWMMFVDHPLLGVGWDNYPVYYQEYSRQLGLDPRLEQRQPHNLYLEVAAERGLVGLAAFGVLLGVTLSGLWGSWRTLRRRKLLALADLVAAYSLGLMGYLTAAMFIHNAYSRYLWLLIGIALAVPRLVQNELARRQHG